jgi:hypothetical protein
VQDWEGLLKLCLKNEARFTGARRVYNWITTDASSGVLTAASGWTLVNSTSVVGATDPDGGVTAYTLTATAGNGDIRKAIDYAANVGSVRNSIYIRRITGSGTINLFNGGAGSTGTNITASVTTSWQRIAAPVTTVGGGGIIGIQLVTSGDSVAIWHPQAENVTGQSNQNPSEYVSVGVLSAPFHGAGVDGVKYFTTLNGNTVASNVVTEATGAAITPANGASTLTTDASGPFGYLAEGQRENKIFQSNSLTTTWVDTGTTGATQNLLGPDGATSGWTLTDNDAGAAEYKSQDVILTAATHTYSVLVKKTSGAQSSYPIVGAFQVGTLIALATIDTSNGVATNWTGFTGYTIATGAAASISSFDVNWWRVQIIFTATAATWTMFMMPAGTANATQSTGGFDNAVTGTAGFAWNQLEAASFASSYIPTTTAAVTRNADVLTYALAGNLSNTAGSLYNEATVSSLNVTSNSASVGDSGGNGRMYYNGATTPVNCFDGTNTVAGPTISAISANSIYKGAISWSGSSLRAFANGSAGTAGTYDGTLISANIAIGEANGTVWQFGNTRNVRIYPTALPVAQLQAMTTP